MFTIYMIVAIGWFYDAIATTALGEILNIFTTQESQFQWFVFDSALVKLTTLFVAPIFVFDAISGDRHQERLGLYLSRPISRTQHVLVRTLSAFVAFGIVYLPLISLGYLQFTTIVPGLTPGPYFATSFLLYLLAFFSMSVGIFISVVSKNNMVSFLATFGIMSFAMLPNAMKYSMPAMETAAIATPHYYATYFIKPGNLDALSYIGIMLVMILFCLPFLYLAIWRFNKEDL